MQGIFLEYKLFIVFLHVISAVVWVGGMIAMRYGAHYSFMEIESPQKRLERISHGLKRLFYIVLPFVAILLITAIFMIKGYALSQSDFSMFTYIKEGIWTIMFLNLSIMIYRRNKADKLLNSGDFLGAKNQLGLIGKYMVPLNIILGVSAVFIGTYFSSRL
ncbi:MAG: hypothetical protein A2513_10685 [Sulfurimonas sp. RIFOXYD12_FULL_33_39]|uniref:hypothetical protein n=1 Tax=unclassified Sulfurimonas TaxID=2623549 RepID=UPI0008CF8C4D|nr:MULTISPECIES: hypothetical protein [unclassified Sulfurimonas]OHE06889.1 MAG: hypothetical protein A3G74_01935 [Sulfurimonas sp. RIFCSPLOWO2_12_FULL_34_6]OHE09772.1 MAG: hypothetical protein A2513_10685 [Sulfurimonas sp. RIFOXYD12_FULL_33_39]OHE13720.1 MAG: hypothetical protein A2530_09070 [Sulfurimonas sp. RIFOXYD2_FULL_34_21]DAB28065.1 MAG TPA: hypothetical protein CFH78_04180 [Sulfurimonas sp. UBA10385]